MKNKWASALDWGNRKVKIRTSVTSFSLSDDSARHEMRFVAPGLESKTYSVQARKITITRSTRMQCSLRSPADVDASL